MTRASACARSARRSGSPNAHRIITELADAGYVSRGRTGRRNHYAIQSNLPLPDLVACEQKIGDLLAVLS